MTLPAAPSRSLVIPETFDTVFQALPKSTIELQQISWNGWKCGWPTGRSWLFVDFWGIQAGFLTLLWRRMRSILHQLVISRAMWWSSRQEQRGMKRMGWVRWEFKDACGKSLHKSNMKPKNALHLISIYNIRIIHRLHLRRVRTTKPGWCGLKANRIYPGWIRLAHVRTRSGLMRVQWTWTVWATSRRLKRTTTRAPVARLSVYSALQRSKNVLDARARSAPFLTQFQPTWTHIRMWVGWTRVQPGFTKSGLSADSQYPSSIWVEPGFAR